jgi:hypothetical protein
MQPEKRLACMQRLDHDPKAEGEPCRSTTIIWSQRTDRGGATAFRRRRREREAHRGAQGTSAMRGTVLGVASGQASRTCRCFGRCSPWRGRRECDAGEGVARHGRSSSDGGDVSGMQELGEDPLCDRDVQVRAQGSAWVHTRVWRP